MNRQADPGRVGMRFLGSARWLQRRQHERIQYAHRRRRRTHRLRAASQLHRREPDDGGRFHARWRPDDPGQVLRKCHRAQHDGPVHAGPGRRAKPGRVVRRQEAGLRDALPEHQHLEAARWQPGLHQPVEHLGIRYDDRRFKRRHVPAHHQRRRRRRRTELPACGPRLRVHLEPADHLARPTRPSATPTSAPRRVRARASLQPAHGRCQRRQHHAALGQPEPRPQPDGAPERRHHVLALGPRRRPQPLQGVPRQA